MDILFLISHHMFCSYKAMYEADIQCIIISLQRSSYILAKDFIVLRRCIFGKNRYLFSSKSIIRL